MSPESLLDVRDVSVRFGGVQALESVSLGAQRGCVTGLIGPNGAGKTTLFNVLSGLQRPDHGRVRLADKDITRLDPGRRAHLGLARTFQRLELFWSLSVADNVRVGGESNVQWWRWSHVRGAIGRNGSAGTAQTSQPAVVDCRAVGDEAISSLLSRVGLEGLGARPVDSLPTGQARLVELARALAIGPKVLLLDEPGSGLDDRESDALGSLLKDLASEGMAVLLVEHDMNLLMGVCDQVYVLDFGELIASGTPDEVRGNPEVQSAYLGSTPVSSEPPGPRSEPGPGIEEEPAS